MAAIPTFNNVPRHGLAMVANEGRSPQDLSSVPTAGTQQLQDAAHKSSLHQLPDSAQQYIVTIAGDRSVHNNGGGGVIDDAVYQSCYGNEPHVAKHVTFTTLSDDHMQQQQHYVEYMEPISSNTQYYNTSTADLPMTSNGHMLGTDSAIASQAHDGCMYFVHGDNMSMLNSAGQSITSATPRASPATVQWLLDNYETAEGVSLPRSTLYNHYLRHCAECKLEPMNPASFGKLIRSVFLGLRTRRLGTRGCSKYHYYGIALKASSNYNGELVDSESQSNVPHQLAAPCQRIVQSASVVSAAAVANRQTAGTELVTTISQHHLQYLGEAYGAIPNFGHIELNETLPDGVTMDHLHTYEHLYVQHCEAILHVVVNLQFSLVESLWRSFWNTALTHKVGSSGTELIQHIPVNLLQSLCCMPSVVKYTRSSDFAFYQALVEVLIPDVLRPIPSTLTQVIRNFAKSLESSLKSSMSAIPETMVNAKVSAVSTFAQTLRRYTSLNHLAQAARAVLQNSSQVQQMLIDLNRIDFGNIQEQASWVCQCDDAMIRQLEIDLKTTLEQQNGLEHWAKWLESVLDRVLVPNNSDINFTRLAQQFLLKWSFYCSMIIRDLTLRSAASFGSFHLIRLLFDEYMFYLVEHKIAAVSGCLPIEAMANCQLVANSHIQASERESVKRAADGSLRQSDVILLKTDNSTSIAAAAGSASGAPPTSTFSFSKPIGTPVKLSIAALPSPARSLGFVNKLGSAVAGRTVVMIKHADNSTPRLVDKKIA